VATTDTLYAVPWVSPVRSQVVAPVVVQVFVVTPSVAVTV